MELKPVLIACVGVLNLLLVAGCKQSSTPETPASSSSSSATALDNSPLANFDKDKAAAGAPLPTTGNASAAMPIPPAPQVNAKSYAVLDFASGQLLASSNEQERLEPASLTKLMTSYIVFDALRIGKLKLTDQVTISEHAWRTGGAGSDGSTSFLPIGSQAPVDVLIKGMIVQSGNDASIALAEHIAGNEATFAQLMRTYAQRIGMTGSGFGNATGLPSPEDYTTAYDMALLARALIRDFPEYYHYFSEREFTFNGITQHNRNGLLMRDSSVDGLKTGHTEGAGYCLVSSSQRNGMRLISVVMGTRSIKAREDASMALLNYGYSFYETRQLYAANQVLKNVPVFKGKADSIELAPNTQIQVTMPRGRADAIQSDVVVQEPLIAPLTRATAVGQLKLTLDGKELASYPLYPTSDVLEAGFFGRMIDGLKMRF